MATKATKQARAKLVQVKTRFANSRKPKCMLSNIQCLQDANGGSILLRLFKKWEAIQST